ncbi:MAG TPA: hypothetical protein VN951_02345 [Pyrinomonadaceae bacterium]|nr:hypothetical protein [Pyrinomonadaceae bacterium]
MIRDYEAGILIFASALLVVSGALDAAMTAQTRLSSRGLPKGSMIDNIKDIGVVQDCGCYFSLPGEERKKLPKWIFLAELNEESAWMNLHGQDVKLRLTYSTDRGRAGVGNRLTRTYVADGVKVSVLYISTRVCKPDDEQCESIDYNATFTVTKGPRKQILKLKGGCGC